MIIDSLSKVLNLTNKYIIGNLREAEVALANGEAAGGCQRFSPWSGLLRVMAGWTIREENESGAGKQRFEIEMPSVGGE